MSTLQPSAPLSQAMRTRIVCCLAAAIMLVLAGVSVAENSSAPANAKLATATKAATPEHLTEQQAEGKKLFEKTCIYCHGEGQWGTRMLEKRLRELNEQFESLPKPKPVRGKKARSAAAKRVGTDQAELVKRDNLAPDYVQCVVRHGLKNMPAFTPTDLTNVQIDLVSSYLTRNNPVAVAPVARGADCKPLQE